MNARGPFFCKFATDSVCADVVSRKVGLLGEVGRLDGEEHFLLVQASFSSGFSQFLNICMAINLKEAYALWELLAKLAGILLPAHNNDIVELTLVFVDLSVNSTERIRIRFDFYCVGITLIEKYYVSEAA